MASLRLCLTRTRNDPSAINRTTSLTSSFRGLRTSRSMSNIVDYKLRDGVAVCKFSVPGASQNTLTQELISELPRILDTAVNDSSVKSIVVISGKPGSFIAGADVNMLSSAPAPEGVEAIAKLGQAAFDRLENCPKPIVAAINGPCLGGGLEFAMACHYRIATDNSKTVLGQPEVMLGLLPGAGGTQRLPKLIPFTEALSVILAGKSLNARKAKKLGLIDHIVEPLGPGSEPLEEQNMKYLEDVAVMTANDIVSGKIKSKKTMNASKDHFPFSATSLEYLASRIPFVRNYIMGTAKKGVMKLTKGKYPAPLKIIDLMKMTLAGNGSHFEEEAKAFGELAATSESRSLLNIFHGQTACKKNNFPKPERVTKNLAVLGAGLMGSGIAQVSIDKGMHTVLADISQPMLAGAETNIYKGLDKKRKRKKITAFQRDTFMSNLSTTLDYNQLKTADIVIEAVFEDINLKHKIIKQVEEIIPEHCVFASNTSALPIGDIATASKRPEKVVGMHYFSPVDKMPLLEIISTSKTSKDTMSTAVQVGLRQGKTVICVNDGPGFYTTRILAPFTAECFTLLSEGVDPHKLDELTTAFGFPVGVVTLADKVGLDVALHISHSFNKIDAFKKRFAFGSITPLEIMVNKGFKGDKTKMGFFDYTMKKKGSKRPLNAELEPIISPYLVTPKGSTLDQDIQMRLVTRMVNEAVLCLEEGILFSPKDGDIGAVFGLGFPPFLGGPFFFVDSYGADKLVKKMESFAADYNVAGLAPFQPAQTLLDMAKDPSKKFYSK